MSELGLAQEHVAASENPSSSAKLALDKLTARLQALQQSVADAGMYLPSYDQRRAQEDIDKATLAVEDKRTQLAPRKKFSFKARR